MRILKVFDAFEKFLGFRHELIGVRLKSATMKVDHIESEVELPELAPFAVSLGLRTASVGSGRAVLTLEPREDLMNRRGVVHGGVLATMVDSAMARASRTVAGVSELGGTTDLHVQYLRPGIGSLRVEAWVEHAAKSMSFCRAEVRNAADELVAVGSASLKLRRASRSAIA